MKNQIPEKVKTERLMRLQELLMCQQRAFNDQTVGKELDVLLIEEGKKKGQLLGYTPYLQGTHVSSDKARLGDIVRVKITGSSATSLSGEVI